MTWEAWRFAKQDISTSSTVLEIGCGSGKFWNGIDSIGKDIDFTLTDISDESLKICKESVGLKNVDFLQADVMALPFDSRQFDHLICDFVLHQVGDVEVALCELARVVKGNGVVGIATFGLEHKSRYWDIANMIDSSIGYPLQKEMEAFCENNAPKFIAQSFTEHTAHVWESVACAQNSVSVMNFFRVLLERGAEMTRPQSFYDEYETIIRTEIDRKGSFQAKDKLLLFRCG